MCFLLLWLGIRVWWYRSSRIYISFQYFLSFLFQFFRNYKLLFNIWLVATMWGLLHAFEQNRISFVWFLYMRWPFPTINFRCKTCCLEIAKVWECLEHRITLSLLQNFWRKGWKLCAWYFRIDMSVSIFLHVYFLGWYNLVIF